MGQRRAQEEGSTRGSNFPDTRAAKAMCLWYHPVAASGLHAIPHEPLTPWCAIWR